jgi:2-(1,2-epoxy-1,2-dihydrophenyl)acetyl-CoA isomerase
MANFVTWSEFDTVRLERDGGAVRLYLNRPKALNAWVPALGRDMLAALKLCEAGDVRAVAITGAGRAFSSGADLNPDAETAQDVSAVEVLRRYYHPVFVAVRNLAKPVVAEVNGAAAGIGCSLALACDLVTVAESAFFLLAFVRIGLVPDGGSSIWVPARVGGGRAFEMSMLGDRVSGAQAVAWGLANRLLGDKEFHAGCDEMLQELAAGPTLSYAGTKRQLNNRIYAGYAEQLDLEAEIQEEMMDSKDFLEGVAAFRERRDAIFAGA